MILLNFRKFKMSNTQEVIVYSNPAEKMMWDLLMSGDAFPLIMFFVSYLVFLIIYFRSLETRRYTKKTNAIVSFLQKNHYLGFVLMAVPSYFVYQYFVI